MADADDSREPLPNVHVEFVDIGFGPSAWMFFLGESITFDDDSTKLTTRYMSRLTMAPTTAKRLAADLARTIAEYEERYGVIWTQPATDPPAEDS